jgi:hypothetical protein
MDLAWLEDSRNVDGYRHFLCVTRGATALAGRREEGNVGKLPVAGVEVLSNEGFER